MIACKYFKVSYASTFESEPLRISGTGKFSYYTLIEVILKPFTVIEKGHLRTVSRNSAECAITSA